MKNSSKTASFKKITAIILITVIAFALSITAYAVTDKSADTASAETAQTEQAEKESSEKAEGVSGGMGLIAAAVVTSIAGIGGGIAIAAAAPAAIAATSEDPKAFGKSLIFVALGESIVLFGFVVSILILNKV